MTDGAVSHQISVTVKDCDSSADNCECAWLEFTSDVSNWGVLEYTKPSSNPGTVTLLSAVGLSDKHGVTLSDCTIGSTIQAF